MRRCEEFWKLELSGCGVKGGGGCRENTVVYAYPILRNTILTSHFLNEALSSGIVCTGTPSDSPTVLSGAAIGKARESKENVGSRTDICLIANLCGLSLHRGS